MPSNPLHRSLSFDDRDQFDSEASDENLFYMAYLQEPTVGVTSVQKPPVKDVIESGPSQQAIAINRLPTTNPRHQVSPYLQKLPHSNYLNLKPPTSSGQTKKSNPQRRRDENHNRRRSASTTRTGGDSAESADRPSTLDHLDLSSFFHVNSPSLNRPISAPLRAGSASKKKSSTRSNTQKKGSKVSGFLITIYRNGDHERCCYCKATSLNAIFQYATEKLRLSKAARRLFNSIGEEIYREEDIQANQEYYVSSGENFKDPLKMMRVQTEYGLNSTWTSKGLQLDTNKPRVFKTKTVLSKRLDEQIKTNINLTITENGSGSDDALMHILVDAVLKENFEKFLEECTKKLELVGFARKAFNYRGEEIKSLRTFLESDENTMQTTKFGQIVGPIWLSKGERFRPTGAYEYLQIRHNEFRTALKELKEEYKKVLNDIEKQQDSLRIANEDEMNVASEEMPVKERKTKGYQEKISQLNIKKQKFEKEMEEIDNSIEFYRSKMEEIEEEKRNEEMLGAKFAIEHIKEIKFEDKILGRPPLTLIIHENGTIHDSDPIVHLNLRSLPMKKVDQTPIEYLLDHLQTSIEMFARQRPKRIFDINGDEIKTLGKLESKQHYFVSYGEDYRPAFEPCLTIQLHGVMAYNVNQQTCLVKSLGSGDEIATDSDRRSGKSASATWKPVDQFSSGLCQIKTAKDLKEEELQALHATKIQDRISLNTAFLQKDNKLMYPELIIAQRSSFEGRSKSGSDKASAKRAFGEHDLQTWFYNKNGFIYNKKFPTLALTVIVEQDIRLSSPSSKPSERTRDTHNLTGYGVQLRSKKKESADNQIWIFTIDGFIVSKAFQDMALTSLATILPEIDGKIAAHGLRHDENDPLVSFLGLCKKCSANSPFIHLQRWGIRQESQFTIGDWKYSKVENPIWHKMALTWPVDETGAMISDLQWPVEGCLIPGVPPIKSLKSTKSAPIFVPIRLQVLKNGERDQSKAVSVVGPDITNLITPPKSSSTIYRRLHLPEPEKEQRADRKLKRDADARQREIKLFLESCTTLCNLPFAARRLFDIHGTEIFDLTSIERDAYVYVTCGEQWIDPELTKAEQQRRLLLAYLTNDVRMMHFYCSLRNPTEYAVSVESGLIENSPLVLTRCSLNAKQRDRVKQGESIEQVIENEEPIEALASEPEPRTAHERAHKKMEKLDREKIRPPWEQNSKKNQSVDTDDDDVIMGANDDQTLNESFVTTGDTLSLSKITRKIPQTLSVNMQRFRWEPVDGYISCFDDANMVISAREIEGKVVDVFLKRRNPDDIFQRWILIPSNATNHQFETCEQAQLDLTKPFVIASKARPSMLLTVLLPAFMGNESNETSVSCVGCLVTLQQRREEEHGCAHQKWAYDEILGFLFPFNSTVEDKEITAANRANICSYTVNYEAVSQPGYVVSILNSNDQAESVPVCLACAQAMRGKYRLTKIDPNMKFTCAIGKRRDLKFHGPFQCLNNKVDLTRDEAENTLFQRQEQLELLRQEASVRNIVKELSAAKPIQVVRLLAYRNGDGHTKPGQILVGSSIVGLLDQATRRLNLTNAARRLYVIDGTTILTVEDLIQWMSDYYKKRFLSKSKTTMLDKVQVETPLPPKNPDSHRRASADNQSEKTTFSSKLRSISPSKQRFQSLPKSADLKKAIKQNPATKAIEIDINYLLKFPIEIWVSTGEPFVNPSDADQRQVLRNVQREQRAIVEHDLEKEKHILRLMKGRRLFTQASGELVAQQNPEQPVIKLGHWTDITDAEVFKQDDVELLRNSLDEILISQQPEVTRPISSVATDRLSQHSRTKRVLVYLNGEPKETAVQCFGTNIDELKANAKLKWNLMLPVQVLFDEHGQLIERFDQLERDQYVCVSTTKTFISSSQRQEVVDIKANWARTRNKFGDQATDIRVNLDGALSKRAVDPFGPPLLTFDDHQRNRIPLNKPPIVPTANNRRLAIQQQNIVMSTCIQEINAPSPLARDSLLSSEEDDGTDSEIERITNLDDDQTNVQSTLPLKHEPRTTNAFSPILREEVQLTTTTVDDILRTKSDTDDDTDDFIRMLKGT